MSEGVLLLVVSSIGVVAWWGVRRLVSGQDAINSTLQSIHTDIAHIDTRVSKVETRLEMHERYDTEQHQTLMKATSDMMRMLKDRGN